MRTDCVTTTISIKLSGGHEFVPGHELAGCSSFEIVVLFTKISLIAITHSHVSKMD